MYPTMICAESSRSYGNYTLGGYDHSPIYRDHFKRHKSRQCDRCYRSFEEIDDLMAHRRHEPCSPRSPSLKEGIDDSQQEKLDNLLKTKRGMSYSQKVDLEMEKWFDAWRILFPEDKELPSNPCTWTLYAIT